MYLDPGFGSMIIQIVVASLAAISGVWFIFKKQVKALFSKRKHTGDAEAETSETVHADCGAQQDGSQSEETRQGDESQGRE